MNKTKIEWCDSTWNPVTGCFHKCEYCYARRIARRFGGASETHNNETCYECQWITEAEGEIHELDEPIYDFDRGHNAPYPFEFDPTFHRYRLDEPARWKKPRTIFVCSMADLFGAWVPDSWIEGVFAACEKAPQHRYLFLTKNPHRLVALAKNGNLPEWKDNWWFGSTVTDMNMKRYPGRISDNTFISIEPLLECMDVGLGSFGCAKWLIIGAETGNRKNKVVPQKHWIDLICDAADITHMAVFMKDSLIPIVGEENMRREFPWEIN